MSKVSQTLNTGAPQGAGVESMEHGHPMKTLGDITAASTAVATLFQWLPAIAALFTIVWTATRLYEAFTGKPFSESAVARFFTGR